MSLYEKLNDDIGIAVAKVKIGALYADKGKYKEGLKSANEALVLLKGLLLSSPPKNKQIILMKMGNAYNVLAHNSISSGNYNDGFKNSFLALKVREEIGDKKGVSDTEFNIGLLYVYQHNYDQALKHFIISLKISLELGDKVNASANYGSIGNIYFEQKNYAEALKNYSLALKEAKDKNSIAEAFNCFGILYYSQGYYNEALKYNLDALKILEELGINEQVSFACNNIASVYIKLHKYNQATSYLTKALAIAEETRNLEYIKLSYENWSILDSAQGNYKQAFQHYKLFIASRDSLYNEESTKKITQQQMQYDFDKKEAATKAEQDKKQALAVAEIQKQKLVRNFSFAGIFVVLLIGGYGFYRFRKNKQLENQQALLAERLRISRELHDDMGSTLSSISVYSEVAKNRAAKNENETEVLLKIGNASRELIEKMSDIVWSLNPNNENFEQLKNRMMAFAAMMLTPKGILFEFEIDDEVQNTSIAPEQRKNIFLIYKEAINNIVKYSEAKEVKVKMNVKENRLSLAIVDNGVGFDSLSFGEGRGEVYNGNGLKNMKARAEEIKALFNITSAINEGVKIELAFRI
jgi:signal transduction histidine kinase